ncbi:unnamed protein product [Dovyalis caffra]|uniref:Uncharacterized protein n=1 Tax=Dovyalis caffra TaxID=77055 RepID=A0AAV1SQC4_9ROSI|nr:unnamed protein product [Dovyalis caffra]
MREERQLKEASIKRWLDQLKDVSYDMDDVLDEWGTRNYEITNEVVLRCRIARKIKDPNERIDRIVIEKDRDKKFLLVLDDVWNEDSTKWEQPKSSLKCGLPRSRVLVTTRNKNVASSMGSTPTDILELKPLSEEECCEFKKLPEAMCELYNMQTLDVLYNMLKKPPDNIGKPVKLRYLGVYNRDGLTMRGLEGLSSLRELDAFYVSSSEDGGEVSNLGDLKNLNHLQGYLRIGWLGNVTDPEDAKKA